MSTQRRSSATNICTNLNKTLSYVINSCSTLTTIILGIVVKLLNNCVIHHTTISYIFVYMRERIEEWRE